MATQQQTNASAKAKESKAPSASEYASRLRLNEQAALMLNVDLLTDATPSVKGVEPVARKNMQYKNFALFREGQNGHIDLTKRIYRNDAVRYLIKNVPTKVLSSLLPSIKLYKVFFPNTDKASRNKSYSWRVPFDDVSVNSPGNTSAFQEKSIEEILAGNGRLHGVGIKSFNYKYVGVNPAEVNTNIQADLELFFQNVSDLVKPIEVTANQFSEPIPDNLKLDFMYAHLAVDTAAYEYNETTKRREANQKYFRLKAVIGYAEPSDTFLKNLLSTNNSEEIEKIKNAIRTAKIILYLTPTNHDISFEENGTVTMKISYIAAMTSSLIELDCLSLTAKHDEFEKKKDEYDQTSYNSRRQISELKTKPSRLSEKEREQQIKTSEQKALEDTTRLQNELENTKNEVYSEVFKRLIGLSKDTDPQGRVYSALFSKYALGITSGNKVADNSTQVRIQNLKDSRSFEQYKSDSITDEDKKYLSVANVPQKISVPKNSNPKKPKEKDITTAENIHKQRAEKNVRSSATIQEIKKKGYSKIKFVFLGDLLDIFCSVINTRIKNTTERPRFVFTDFQIQIPNESKIEKGTKNIFDTDASYITCNLNVADIPISIHMLQQFFLENIINPRKNTYPLVSFINDLMVKLIAPAISPSVFGRKTVLNNGLRISNLNLTIPFTADGKDPLTKQTKEQNFSGIVSAESMQLISPEFFSERSSFECGNYLIFYCSNKPPSTIIGSKIINGNFANWLNTDESNGIYHLSIGTDVGFIKKMNFAKVDTPFYKEARLNGSTGDKTIARFREVYDVTVTMFGNNIYRPGDFFYIEPLFFSDKQAIDLQNKLGLGGYYQVTEVGTTISDSNYETSIKSLLLAYVEEEEVKPA